MNAPTSARLIAVIDRIKAERALAACQDLMDDAAVLDEELYELRMALLQLRWKETQQTREAR